MLNNPAELKVPTFFECHTIDPLPVQFAGYIFQ